MVIERRSFLYSLAAAGLAPAAVRSAPAAEPLHSSLVLSGGGALGAYEAGVVGALAAMGGAADGSILAPYELVCGASIGALNGWFVATGQYKKMRELWYGIAGAQIIRPKRRYAALRDPESGLFDRAASAVSLLGLTRDQSAILESEPVYDWIAKNVDPSTPLVMPLIWAVTNLSRQQPEYFFLDPKERSSGFNERVTQALKISLGPQTVVREATPALLHRALFASAAIPIAFDPVLMPGPDGETNAYCDGGVASNSPVGIAHAVAQAADVVLLTPPFEPEANLEDAVAVAFGAYGTMQRKLLEVEMRTAYFQSVGRRALEGLTASELGRVTRGNRFLARYVESVPQTELRYIRPTKELSVGTVGFSDEAGISAAYRTGWEDAGRGFTPYDWETFVL